MGPDPKTMALMAEPDALLDALEERIPKDPELRDGIAELVFHGALRSEFGEEIFEEREAGRGEPPAGMGYP